MDDRPEGFAADPRPDDEAPPRPARPRPDVPRTPEEVARWRAEHADVIALYNAHVEEHGVFGEEWRTF